MHDLNDIGDKDRIKFLQERDTAEEVMFFVKQCVRVYRGATLASKRKYNRRGTYRLAFIRSYLFHKRFIKENSPEDL